MRDPYYVTAKEFLGADLGEAYLVEGPMKSNGRPSGIIPVGGRGMMHGKRQTFKTHIMFVLALCLSRGVPLFGKYKVTKKCRVAIVQCDMPDTEQQERVMAAAQAYRMSDNVLFCFPGPTNIPSLKKNSELIEELERFGPDLIMWDALKVLHHLDPNEDRTAAIVYNRLQSLLPEATHLLGHHDRKTNTSKDALITSDEEFSGASGWIDMADFCLHTIKMGETRVNLHFTKTRGAPYQPPIPLHLYEPYLLPYTQIPVQELARTWRKQHPKGKKQSLHTYLLNTFACSPKIAHNTAYNRNLGKG